jgi:hypothetical protein
VGTQAKRACVKSGSARGEVMNQYQIEGQQMLIDSLEESIDYMKTQYVNQDISHAYKSDRLITKISCVLEGELNIVLQKALIANSKGKQEITAYQIQDALDILARELSNLTKEKS